MGTAQRQLHYTVYTQNRYTHHISENCRNSYIQYLFSYSKDNTGIACYASILQYLFTAGKSLEISLIKGFKNKYHNLLAQYAMGYYLYLTIQTQTF